MVSVVYSAATLEHDVICRRHSTLKPVTHDPTSWMKTVECYKLDAKPCRVSYHTIIVVWIWMELDGVE